MNRMPNNRITSNRIINKEKSNNNKWKRGIRKNNKWNKEKRKNNKWNKIIRRSRWKTIQRRVVKRRRIASYLPTKEDEWSNKKDIKKLVLKKVIKIKRIIFSNW